MPSVAVARLKRVVGNGWPAPAAGLLALALYARTLAPGLTWAHHGADGGDLLAAALTAGVPHPTGYPTYQLLLRTAIPLFPGEPARAGNWLSALAAACAVAVLADLARRVLADGWPAQQGWHPVIALVAALTWAASPLLWSQAVITEVYTLHTLAVVLILWLLWRWRAVASTGRPARGWPAAVGLALGLGLGNHISLALMLPAMATWMWRGIARDGDRGTASRPAASPATQSGLAGSSNPSPGHPPQRLPWPTLAAGLALGLSIYAYLPLAAARSPAVNWGDPSTLAGFWWTISGRAYATLFLGLAPDDLLARVAAWARMAAGQFGGGPWGLFLALAGLWWTDRQQHLWWQATGLVALAYTAYSLAYRTADSYVYLLPVWAVAALWLAAGLSWLISTVAQGKHLAWALALAALLLPAGGALAGWQANDLSRDGEARAFVSAVLAEAEPGALILVATDRPTFALWYAIYGLGQRRDIIPLNVHLYGFEWYRMNLHRHHPDLTPDSDVCTAITPLEQLVEQALAGRPVYRAEPIDVPLPGTRETRAGVLIRIWLDS
ncbi:MAG: protein O-mannosyl-transferase family [Anaerolineae bacterium]